MEAYIELGRRDGDTGPPSVQLSWRWWDDGVPCQAVLHSSSLYPAQRRKIERPNERKRRINSWREIAVVHTRLSVMNGCGMDGYRGCRLDWCCDVSGRSWKRVEMRFSCLCEITSQRIGVTSAMKINVFESSASWPCTQRCALVSCMREENGL